MYGSKDLFGAGNEKVAVPQVQAIEAGKKPKLLKAASPDDIAALSQYLAGMQIDAYLGSGR